MKTCRHVGRSVSSTSSRWTFPVFHLKFTRKWRSCPFSALVTADLMLPDSLVLISSVSSSILAEVQMFNLSRWEYTCLKKAAASCVHTENVCSYKVRKQLPKKKKKIVFFSSPLTLLPRQASCFYCCNISETGWSLSKPSCLMCF